MNKQEFLNELQSRIRILEEAEQQDILAEYAQHIDLRTAGGLSEEEAIRDFGNPEELAADLQLLPQRLCLLSITSQVRGTNLCQPI